MQSRCGPCTGACAPSPMPRLLRPVPAFPVFCCPRPVARVLRPAPRARVFRLLHFVPPFPVFCCPRPVARVLRPAFCVLRSASCVLRPAPRAPVPVPASASASTCSAFCVPRPTPASSVFRVPHPHPRPRTRVSCTPCPWLRLLRPADGCPCSAPCLPPRTSGQVLPASARCRDEKKIGRFPTGTSRFCMHCSGASYSRLRIISPPW